MCKTTAPAAINFAGAADSWNGGNIIFQLLDGGRSRHLIAMDMNEHIYRDLQFILAINDILMGIGETNTVNFK
jgi:hypothetical protein